MRNDDPLLWLLEEDRDNPTVRYLALRDLLDEPEGSAVVRRARESIMGTGPVPRILAAQQPDGRWVPRTGELQRSGWHYQSTFWQVVFLSALAADPDDPRVRLGCEYVLQHAIAANGAFSGNRPPTPSGAVHCMNGHLLYALPRLGFPDDERVRAAFNWQAQAIIGELSPKQYFKSGTSGPTFACGVNLGQPCGWGAAKAMRVWPACCS